MQLVDLAYFFLLYIILSVTMSAHRRIDRQAHPSRYGASLTGGAAAPKMKRIATRSDAKGAITPAQRRQRMTAAQDALDKGKGRMKDGDPIPQLLSAEDEIVAPEDSPVHDIVAAVQENAVDLGIDGDVASRLIDTIVHASPDVGAPPPDAVNSNPASYTGTDQTERWRNACRNAGQCVQDSHGGYCNVVFGAAGVCGVSYGHAYLYLEKLGLTKQMKNFAGCSSGSIIASLLAMGMSPSRVNEHTNALNFSKLVNLGARSIVRLGRKAGACKGKELANWIQKMFKEAAGDANITFGQLHEKTGGRLVIAAVRLHENRVVYLDYVSEPDMPIWLAVRASCAIPFVYTPVKYKGEYYVDGGLLDPLPIKAFHYENDSVDMINPRTIAFLAINEGVSVFQRKKDSSVAQIASILDCVISRSHQTMMDAQDWARTIVIDCGKISSLDFGINKEQKNVLLERAHTAVVDHFASGTVPVCKDYYGAANNGFSQKDEPPRAENAVVKTIRGRAA